MTRPHVEILYFAGCPNYEATHALVEQLAGELHLEPEIELVEVTGPEAAVELQFLGSPTVRVDGTDVEPGADDRRDFAFACRVYRDGERVAGQPAESWIRDALLEAAT